MDEHDVACRGIWSLTLRDDEISISVTYNTSRAQGDPPELRTSGLRRGCGDPAPDGRVDPVAVTAPLTARPAEVIEPSAGTVGLLAPPSCMLLPAADSEPRWSGGCGVGRRVRAAAISPTCLQGYESEQPASLAVVARRLGPTDRGFR